MEKIFRESDGMRLTNCCGKESAYILDDERNVVQKFCKGCYKDVEDGEGDGLEFKMRPTLSEKRFW